MQPTERHPSDWRGETRQGLTESRTQDLESPNNNDDDAALQARAVEIVGVQLDIERRYLAALWCDPPAGLSAAVQHGLDDLGLFLDGRHQELFAVLLSAALQGQTQSDTLEDVAELLGRVTNRPINPAEIRPILFAESSGAGANAYARLIANPDPALAERTRARLLAYLVNNPPNRTGVVWAGA